ncbi:nagb/rpia/CoA transferase-like protein [Podospora aff. communis PSN243]|uniref:Nagb/rpia/CoA transferase-like protein n=1 Tax=Podospora aff. communis PSN243 TaxID=3040156 RepID=A0AAV9GGR8_9PEZI|nr:nagb/rpia/CoA transferase-like protein [Podospora aff. communis PSN243]
MSTSPAQPLKKRSVVSNFIFKNHADTNPQVALFRRSDKVSTYRHHLAPISGSIDPSDASPLAAAWREISEETTLTPENLTLLRQGKPYTFGDVSVGREWTIYPFAFGLNGKEDEGKITIDWEHEGWGWFDPLDVKDTEEFGGVPKLAESLRRVWFEYDLGEEAGRVLRGALERLAGDTRSGARQMAGYALEVLDEVVAVYGLCEQSEKWWRDIRFGAWHLWKNGRESMGAAIMAVLLGTLAEIEPLLSQQLSPDDFKNEVHTVIRNRIAHREQTTARISTSFTNYITSNFPSDSPLKILTLSESSTITNALTHLAQTTSLPLDIRILESRPLFEGVSLAANLSQSFSQPNPTSEAQQAAPIVKHKITLYTDASSALASSGIDIVLLGADRISSSGATSNKVGSLPAVLSAKHVTDGKVKVVVLGDTEKIALPGPEEEHVIEEGGAGMVTLAWGAEGGSQAVKEGVGLLGKRNSGVEVGVRNFVFEWVPASLINVYIIERGEETAEDVLRQSEKLGEEEKRIFGSL